MDATRNTAKNQLQTILSFVRRVPQIAAKTMPYLLWQKIRPRRICLGLDFSGYPADIENGVRRPALAKHRTHRHTDIRLANAKFREVAHELGAHSGNFDRDQGARRREHKSRTGEIRQRMCVSYCLIRVHDLHPTHLFPAIRAMHSRRKPYSPGWFRSARSFDAYFSEKPALRKLIKKP